MGTSGSYSGAGGKAGKDVTSGLSDWVDTLPAGGVIPAPSNTTDRPDQGVPGTPHVVQLPPKVVSGLLALLRPSSGSGSGSGGASMGGGGRASGGGAGNGGGAGRAGSGRSTGRMSSIGGRAAAGAYAYATGDRATLGRLGLNYDDLRALGDPFEVTRQIVGAVCGPRASSTLEDAEERYVAAAVADYVLTQGVDGSPPDLDDVARYAIAAIMTEVLSSELGAALNERPDQVVAVAESELREAAKALASQARLPATGPTDSELSAAIESGIETLRVIYGGSK